MRVGLCWAGHPDRLGNRTRELSVFAPLAVVEGVDFVSLQTGREAEQGSPAGMKLLRFDLPMSDFSQAAGLIANLDLVISIDTAIAHLAGAMGKRAWTLVPRPCDWRWLLEREDSPWYPTMRLFRQERYGSWDGAIARLSNELNRFESKQ